MKTILIILSFLLSGLLNAQLSIDWYKNSEGIDVYNPKKSVYNSVDSCIYSAGIFSTQFQFDGISIATTYPKAFFLMKTRRNGDIVWLKKIAENDYNVELSSNLTLNTDSVGKLLIAVTFNGKLYYNGDSTVLQDDAFTTRSILFKVDTAAVEEWHRQMFVSNLKAVCTGNNNIIYTTGRDLNDDVFLMAHSAIGDSLWVRTGGSPSGEDIGENIIVNVQDVYITGVIQPNNGVYFDSFHPTFISPYFNGSFLAKYDLNGNIQWVRCFYASNFGDMAWIRAMTICENKIILGGEFSGGIVKFFPSSMTLNSQNPLNLASVLLCYDSSGNKVWTKEHHNNFGGDCSIGKLVNENGRCWVLTEFSGSITIDNQDTISSLGNLDISIDLIDLGGNSLWNDQLSGSNIDGAASFFKTKDDLILNISTKSNSLQIDNTIMTLSPVSDQMVLVRFNVSTLGLDENETSDFSVFPNPTDGMWNLKTTHDLSGKHLQVFSVSGGLVYEQLLDSGNIHQMNTLLPTGVYLIQLSEQSEKPIRLVIK